MLSHFSHGNWIYLKKVHAVSESNLLNVRHSIWLYIFAEFTPKSLTLNIQPPSQGHFYQSYHLCNHIFFSLKLWLMPCFPELHPSLRDPAEAISAIKLIRVLRTTSTMDSSLLSSWQSSDTFSLDPKSWWRKIPEHYPHFLRWNAYLFRLHETVAVASFKPSVKFWQWPHRGT